MNSIIIQVKQCDHDIFSLVLDEISLQSAKLKLINQL